jgi:haloacetate dehalogenase
MALDHPTVVALAAVLDIVPTGEVWRHADGDFACRYWHWAFLALPPPLPERLIAGDPQAFFDLHVCAGDELLMFLNNRDGRGGSTRSAGCLRRH